LKKAFEAIRKNERYCKETLRRYNFKKPIRKTCISEQVGLISIFDYEEEKQKDDLHQYREAPLHKKEPTHE
jgi:hypothetical protein